MPESTEAIFSITTTLTQWQEKRFYSFDRKRVLCDTFGRKSFPRAYFWFCSGVDYIFRSCRYSIKQPKPGESDNRRIEPKTVGLERFFMLLKGQKSAELELKMQL